MKVTKEVKEVIRKEYAKAWDSKKMTDFCTDKVEYFCVLSNGGLFIVDKEHIETSFCFDDSYDYEGALEMADHARTSEDYFIKENLKKFDRILDTLRNESRYGMNHSVIQQSRYYGSEPLNLYTLSSTWQGELQEGQSEFTDEDREKVIALYEEARAGMEKKVRAYLKRYGMSKVHSWTYWGEA